ncbi:MAG: hypothetical protein ACUVTP_05785 [Candidatus Fervidibacter sp.]|uniref:hypothetical protein n=1 Tax=Candidatus Fervidibacter sp. TaxID=3100871 RepID=UPI00404A245E
MSCGLVRKLMTLADGLTKEERTELESHLNECNACAQEWQKWQRFHSFLKQLPSLSSTPEERYRLIARLSQVPPVADLDCATARSLIWRWVDGDLCDQEFSSFIVHLANCDSCQSLLWQSEQTVRMLRSLPRLKATAREKEALKAKLRQMQKRPTVMPFAWRIAFPIAAVAVLTLAIILRWQPSTPDHPISVHPTAQQTPIFAKTEPTKPEPAASQEPQIQTKPQPTTSQQLSGLSVQPQKPKKMAVKRQPEPIRVARITETTEMKTERLILPSPSEPVQTATAPTPEPTVHENVVVEAPKPVVIPTIALPVPSQVPISSATSKLEEREVLPLQRQETPVVASPVPEPRQLVALPPVTVEGDLSLQPPRVKLTVVPPSQRVYQKSGIALVSVPPEKRPIKVYEEKALSTELSIPLAAERYRSHTASIPFFRFGISW